MLPKPKYLKPENAVRFKQVGVVERYHLRLPYPPAIFEMVANLITDEPRTVLDVGTGTGEIARQLINRVERVDAVDFSQAMLAKGKQLPNGDSPKLHWIYGPIEEVALQPPYALITAGDSMHWMNWELLFPRFRQLLTPNGFVAMIHRQELPAPWQTELNELISRFSTPGYGYELFDLNEELEKRGLFQKFEEESTALITSKQSVEDYIACFHSRSSLALESMRAEAATAFDTELRKLVSKWSKDDYLELQTVGSVFWGKPT